MNYYNIKQWRWVRMKWIKRKSCTNTWNCPKQVQVLGLKCCWDLCSLIPHDRIHRMWKMLEKIIKKSNKTQSCSWCNKTFFSRKKFNNPQMVQHVENVKNFERRDETYNMHRMQEMNVLGKIIYRICAITCQKSEQEVAVYARKISYRKWNSSNIKCITICLTLTIRAFQNP